MGLALLLLNYVTTLLRRVKLQRKNQEKKLTYAELRWTLVKVLLPFGASRHPNT